jgi:hypothetical protein
VSVKLPAGNPGSERIKLFDQECFAREEASPLQQTYGPTVSFLLPGSALRAEPGATKALLRLVHAVTQCIRSLFEPSHAT